MSIEKNTAENVINKKDQNFNSSEIIKKSIINNFKKNYTIFLNRKGKNTFDINLMKLIYTEITILMGETLNLDLKARNKFLLANIYIGEASKLAQKELLFSNAEFWPNCHDIDVLISKHLSIEYLLFISDICFSIEYLFNIKLLTSCLI